VRDSLKIAIGIFIGIVAAGACFACALIALSAGGISLLSSSMPSIIAPDLPDECQGTIFPSSSDFPPVSIIDENFEVRLIEYEISDSYVIKSEGEELPPEGAKFLWLHIAFENIGSNAADAPSGAHFSVLYQDEYTYSDAYFDDTWGFESYRGGETFPGVSRQGWLRFAIPSSAEPEDIGIVYSPIDVLSTDRFLWCLSQ